MITPDDPRHVAEERFTASQQAADLIDLNCRYATDPPLIGSGLLEAVCPPRLDGRICELGFGTGWLLEEITGRYPEALVFGLDMSRGMTRRAQEMYGRRIDVIRGDMEWLPFQGQSFDIIVTCWTLYFMRDIDAAIAGIKRCLQPGGRLVAATNAPEHLVEYEELRAEAFRAALGREPDVDNSVRFDLESGEPYMRRHFGHVERRDWRGEMALPAAEHVVQMWDAWRPRALPAREVELVRAEMLRLASGRLARDGAIMIRRHSGAFIASD